MRRLLAPVAVVAALAAGLAGCGLPLGTGVQEPGQVAAERVEAGEIKVVPPGPRPDATPEELVRGFLRAQSSPEDRHAVARQFLAPGLRQTWDDRDQVVVIEPARREITADPVDPSVVDVTELRVGHVGADGAFRLERREVPEEYRVERQPSGELLLSEVPPGLRLSDADLDRSRRPYSVYYLGPSGDSSAAARLVPDLVLLPSTLPPAVAVTQALVRGPSSGLRGAVSTAVPRDTELVRVEESAGVVTVELSEQVLALGQPARARLSAQLVWTLRRALGQSFAGLRLRVAGAPLQVDGVGTLQDRSDWAEYDPEGLSPRAPAFYVQDRKLRSLDGGLVASPATEDGPLLVDEAAASPVGNRIGLLTQTRGGVVQLRTGPAQGPFGDPVLVRRDLGSLSWGSGVQGLWLLEGGVAPQVLHVPNDATPAGPARPVVVPHERPPGAGPLTGLRVSRDGARMAMVFGSRLYVGRIEPTRTGQRVTAVRPVAPALSDVTDVSWETGTTLVVLARSGLSGITPIRVSVDGSRVEVVQRVGGLAGTPLRLAVAADRPMVVAVEREDGRRVLFRDTGALFVEQTEGSAPFYPG